MDRAHAALAREPTELEAVGDQHDSAGYRTGWLLKRAMQGLLPLMPAIKKLMDEVLAGPSSGDGLEGPLAAERTMMANAKKIALFTAGAASQRYMQALGEQQEIMGALADIVIEAYCVE